MKKWLFSTSVLLAIMSAWSLNTFLRLNKGAKNNNFEETCNVSSTYCKGGIGIAITMLILSLIILFFVSRELFLKKR